ncbi:FAD-binding protein (plasmid) [Streptomyces goshikiensis]|uniref:FAD-binding protein n=2 Tax=Streptomyces goshikiensis TaxID=1942 RepID=A0ABZ1RY18_9ACTN|nr:MULTISPECIES: FAD-binding protein [Streptomyces]AKL70828.1 FAD-linked oxidase [Streptomyces sp. Mg1]EDX23527.1 FAD/FMN-containing dehydrogenase [Streptomyces sp. Mg1]MBP0932177.1 FAD-binding protein [Streptomyces sp. KCTC 0041BP]PJN17610.1 FAD-linked oxidase [Streptomyces sp. CB02120-2]RPK28845.1 putative FAD-linked oxidoreductase YvdP [Streptomyces sp. ADI91-18]
MANIARRALFRGAAATVSAVAGSAALGAVTAAPAVADEVVGEGQDAMGARTTAPTGATITPNDPRYAQLTTGNNQRYVAAPSYVKMIKSAPDAAAAITAAYRAGKRVSVRSGGHCFSNFVCNPDVQVILDCSEMTYVGYDPAMRAFAVEPGARLLNVYEALYKGWGVTLPGGVCYGVGAGGHIAGGGYGLLSRRNGLVVDHLYAVEVVTVDASGTARIVRATREPNDPNRDLWWAHTGGGGGNFGVVTRYWLRSPNAPGGSAATPENQLVSPPSHVLMHIQGIPWSQLDEAKFSRLVKNFGAWHEANSAPNSPLRNLSSILNVYSKASGMLNLVTQVDAGVPDAAAMLDTYLNQILDGVTTARAASRKLPWLQAASLIGTINTTLNDPTLRGAHKSAYMRTNFTDAQLASLYASMTAADYTNPRAMLILFSFGGQVNAVAPEATAIPQRSSAFKMLYQTFWNSAAEDSTHVAWLRTLYANMHAATGGVPGLDGQTDGCYINYPDTDMADPAQNTSGVPWQRLYYKGNYARLQQVKARWDPSDYFRHSMSVKQV